MSRRWLEGRRRVGLGVILAVILVCAATRVGAQPSAPATSPGAMVRPGAPSAQPARESPADRAAAAIAIGWYGRAIENVAIEKVLAGKPSEKILEGLKGLLQEMEKGKLRQTMRCRWPCPPGDCDPECHPRPMGSPRPMDLSSASSGPGTPMPFDRSVTVIRWYSSAIVNAGTEQLMLGDATYGTIRKQLSAALQALQKL